MVRLLIGKNFLPLFITQFLNAFNDNIFKNALILLIVYKSYTLLGFSSNEVVSIASFLFTLPYFIFSPQAGYLADHYSRSSLIIYIKTVEIVFMLFALLGFFLESPGFLIFVLFLMGAQSAFFGPAKLGILPDLIKKDNLLKVNGVFSMGTFLAILLGTAIGGIAMKFNKETPQNIGFLVVLVSSLGLSFSFFIPKTKAAKKSDKKINFNIIREIKDNLKHALNKGEMGHVILISVWIWFLGNAFLILIPNYVKDILSGDEGVATAFMAIFSIGISIGSLLCSYLDKVLKHHFSISKLGIMGMLLSLSIATLLSQYQIQSESLLGIQSFFKYPMAIFIFFNYLILAVFAGIFIVPLYTYIQLKSPPDECSQMIAAMNILQSIGVLASALILFLLFRLKASHSTCMLFTLVIGLVFYYYFHKYLNPSKTIKK